MEIGHQIILLKNIDSDIYMYKNGCLYILPLLF